MFLVPTFCEIVKNDPYILKMVKKNPINFFVIKNDLFCLFFQGQLIECLFVDPAILILVLHFAK
jgi:hypothetical protein